VSRQIDIAKLRLLALQFELTMDIDALHQEADLDKSGEGTDINPPAYRLNISLRV
jgi:hypothetical protein